MRMDIPAAQQKLALKCRRRPPAAVRQYPDSRRHPRRCRAPGRGSGTAGGWPWGRCGAGTEGGRADVEWPRGRAGDRRGQGGDDRGDRRVQGLVLPDPHDLPARRQQGRVGGAVALDVAGQLGSPVPGVRGGLGAVLGAGVPEAAVHEDGDPAGGERDVWPDPRSVEVQPVVLAVPEALAVQRSAQRHLGLGVGPPVGSHVGRAAGAGRVRIVGHSDPG